MAENEGHEADTPKDAFDLTEEEFDAEVSKVESGHEADTPEEITEEAPAEDTTPPAIEEEAPAFEFAEGEQPKAEPEGETYEIIHNGQPVSIKLTPDEHKKWLQKAYHADYLFEKHAKERKFIELIDGDPEAQKILDTHFKKKFGPAPVEQAPVAPQFKSIDEYESDPDKWLQDNMALVQPGPSQEVETLRAEIAQLKEAIPRPKTELESKYEMLRDRDDPELCDRVIAKMGEYSEFTFTNAQKKQLRNNKKLTQYYDFIKKEFFEPKEPLPQNQQKQPGFKVMPQGSAAPTGPGQGEMPDAWAMPDDEFQKFIDKER